MKEVEARPLNMKQTWERRQAIDISGLRMLKWLFTRTGIQEVATLNR